VLRTEYPVDAGAALEQEKTGRICVEEASPPTGTVHVIASFQSLFWERGRAVFEIGCGK
jgi:hypothetical protein